MTKAPEQVEQLTPSPDPCIHCPPYEFHSHTYYNILILHSFLAAACGSVTSTSSVYPDSRNRWSVVCDPLTTYETFNVVSMSAVMCRGAPIITSGVLFVFYSQAGVLFTSQRSTVGSSIHKHVAGLYVDARGMNHIVCRHKPPKLQ